MNDDECSAVMDRALKMVYYDEANVEKDIFAQLTLAQKHYLGDGVPRDEAATRRILDQIHRQSRAFAAVCYGYMAQQGTRCVRGPWRGPAMVSRSRLLV